MVLYPSRSHYEKPILVSVAVPGTPELLTYSIPADLFELIKPGIRVRVPLRRKIASGLIIGFTEEPPHKPDLSIKEIDSIIDTIPILPSDLMQLGMEISRGYVCSPATAFEALLPGGFKLKAPTYLFLANAPAPTPQLLLDSLSNPARGLLAQIAAAGRIILPEIKNNADYIPYTELITSGLVEAVAFCDPLAHALAGMQFFPLGTEPIKGFPEFPSGGMAAEDLKKAGISRERLSRNLAQGKLWARPIIKQCTTKHPRSRLTLTPEQESALKIAEEATKPLLLHGVTSSGKTEVYLRMAEDALGKGKSVVVMVPELALTPQTLSRFSERLGDCIAPLHSGLTAAEKAMQWRRLRRGEARVAIGARSAIFAPVANLGLIVVDEEHDGSYKQDESPRYQALSVAWARANLNHAHLILGSATPSLESSHYFNTGKFLKADLPNRIDARSLPTIELVDLREAPVTDGAPLSAAMIGELEDEISSGGQVMLLLNRRGLHRYALCQRCGSTVICPHCDISLVHHRGDRLQCHYCGFMRPLPSKCPACGSPGLTLKGYGTQMAEEVLRELFPHIELGRLDTDVTAKRGELERVLKRFSRGELQILLGTQMIAKGHDFPTVGLVGIMDADSALSLPDFRSAERTYALITQMAGRAGRGVRAGRVIIQSYHPGHYAVQAAANYKEQEFYTRELEIRKRFRFPPFVRLAQITLEGLDEKSVVELIEKLALWLKERVEKLSGGELLGPTTPMLARLQGRYRRHLLVKSNQIRPLTQVLGDLRVYWHKGMRHPASMRLVIDVDPRNNF